MFGTFLSIFEKQKFVLSFEQTAGYGLIYKNTRKEFTMERTEFQQMMSSLKERNERRRYDALRQKYAAAPDYTNMSLREELETRSDLDELEQLKQKFGMQGSIRNEDAGVSKRLELAEAKENDKYRRYISKYLPYSFVQSYDVLKEAKDEMDALNIIGSDNYYHSVGMCENTQDGRPFSTMMLGGVKEVYDFVKKMKENEPVIGTLADNTKDMGNNIRGVYYGLRYPNQSCRNIFERLDWKTNQMR